jgi:aminopeptidase N
VNKDTPQQFGDERVQWMRACSSVFASYIARFPSVVCRLSFLFVLLNLAYLTTSAEELVCRYCAEGSSHETALGVDLEGTHHYAPDRQVDVKHIKLDVTPDFLKRTVIGTTSITATPIAKAVEILRLDATDLMVKAVHCDEAEIADFVSTRTQLQIAFSKPVTVGSEFTLHIEYSAQPTAGLYFRTPEMGYPSTDTHLWTQGETHEARHWFPCFDYPNERSSTEVICHVPQGMTVLSNGRRMSQKVDSNGLHTVHWLHEKTHPNYLICLVAGSLEKLEKQHGEIPLGFYTQPSLFKHAENSFRDTPSIMKFYDEEIGLPFPWPKYDQVTIHDFTAGGMENTTLTTLFAGTIFAKETENIRSSRQLDAHEMAHQWFGDYVTCKDWSHLWLNEGFATFYTHLYEGHSQGKDAMLYGLYRDARGILSHKDDKKPIVYRGYRNASEQFDYRAYPKGSWVLHMLRSQLGPELYRKCIKAYLEKHALTSVVSDDLRQVIEELSGRPMDRFFDQWLYHPRHPDLKISYTWQIKEKLAKVTVEQTQKVDSDVMLYQFPTVLRFVVDGKTIDRAIEVTKETENFYVSLPGKPSIVRFDPEYTVLADITFDLPNDLLQAQIENEADMIGRLIACKALGGRKTHEAVSLLEKRLNEDTFFGVRIAAVNALSEHESDEAFQVLEKSWHQQSDARVRLEVVRILVSRFSEHTPALIAKILNEERNPDIQAAAIRALGRFQGDETRSRLIGFLQSESFGNVLAVAAMSAIRQHNDSSYNATLMRVLVEREGQFSSRDFGQGLETLGRVARTLQEKDEVRDFLLKYIHHPMTRVRTSAISALGSLGDSTVVSILESFSSSNDKSISGAAERAIVQIREAKPTVPTELVELRKEISTMRRSQEKLQAELNEVRGQIKAKE